MLGTRCPPCLYRFTNYIYNFLLVNIHMYIPVAPRTLMMSIPKFIPSPAMIAVGAIINAFMR